MRILPLQPPKRAALAAATLLAAATPAVAQDSRRSVALPLPTTATTVAIPKLKITDFTLPNGLRVILHEDHSSPIVSTEVWYNAGSKFDPKGKAGLAHMFEHMMDEGTANMPNGELKRIIQSAGGYYNASTQNDFTRYWITVPSNYLETALWLEAERMANLGPSLDSARFNLERIAVNNEYRGSVLSAPPYSAAEAVMETLFAGGAYATSVIGNMAELATATVDDLRRFYDTYYVPNNAVLVVVGDFATADARRKIEKHFSPVSRGKPVTFPTAVVPLVGEKRIVVEHPTNNRGVWGVWRGAPSAAADRPALLALNSILVDRLRRLLVTERRVATTMNPQFNQAFDLQESGVFQVAMTPNATASATMLEEVMDSVIASITANGVTDTEVRRWVGSYRLQMLTSMQADSLKAMNIGDATINQKNPLGVYDMADRAQRVTPAQVQAAARRYLTGDRVIVSIVPTGKFELVSKPQLPYVNASRKEPPR